MIPLAWALPSMDEVNEQAREDVYKRQALWSAGSGNTISETAHKQYRMNVKTTKVFQIEIAPKRRY